MPRYYTFAPGKAPAGRKKDEIKLKPGETLGYQPNKGYYAKPPVGPPMPPKSKPILPAEGHPSFPDVPLPPRPGDPEKPAGEGVPDPKLIIDWRSWLQDWGFPTDVVNTLDAMARRYTPAQAELFTRDALLYLRSTDWHKQTFVGFADAYKTGLIQDERDYRMFVQTANDAYQRFHGRGISTDELLSAFRSGFNPNRIEAELNAGAFAEDNDEDLQYLTGAFGGGRIDNAGVLAIGRQQAGIDNALGQNLLKRVSVAQERMRRIFEGTLATGQARPTPSSASGSNLLDVGR